MAALLPGCAYVAKHRDPPTGYGAGVAARTFVTAQTVPAAPLPAPSAAAERRAAGDGLVRAPEVFQASTIALWNGRRTAGGLWVAHPNIERPIPVRIVNVRSGTEIDGIAYRQANSDAGDILTVSSDAAAALGMTPGARERIAVVALRPDRAISRAERSSAADMARTELASHIARLPHNELLQLAAAAMRGMGYATAFERQGAPGGLPSIRGFAAGGTGPGRAMPPVHVTVRPGSGAPMSAGDVARHQAALAGSGDVGVIVSIAGFAPGAERGRVPGASHVELVDLDGFLKLWLSHYESLSDPDRALLRLEPVYFLAGD